MRGAPEPLGATISGSGEVNFSVGAPDATTVSLCLFERDAIDHQRPTHEIPLSARLNRTGGVWHVRLPELQPGLLYGFRLDGPEGPGYCFDPSVVLLDPYARGIVSGGPERAFAQLIPTGPGGAVQLSDVWPPMAGEIPDPAAPAYDWEGDRPLRRPMEETVLYEAHVRGFTRGDEGGMDERLRGTYMGFARRLGYLASLGVTAVELMPLQAFEELEYASDSRRDRVNFWGYSTLGFFAPMARYSSQPISGHNAVADDGDGVGRHTTFRPLNEFRDLVKAAHREGLEVVLDVVFNHTAEGNERGPTISFRGLDSRSYYVLAPQGQPYNYSGCGNTFNCNHPNAQRFILDCLRFWVAECHVDGFRFDLASILTRAPSVWEAAPTGGAGPPEVSTVGPVGAGGPTPAPPGAVALHPPPTPGPSPPPSVPAPGFPSGPRAALPAGPVRAAAPRGVLGDGIGVPTGTPLADPPLIRAISEDPVLAGTKLIAEAWDCDGLVQLGAFPHHGGRWSEWNGHFRDAVRGFIKGSEGSWVGRFAGALSGSADVFFNPATPDDWWGSGTGSRWRGGRGPTASINFVTAHDGFTLRDLVSYNEKHNESNGEGNRDGESHNLSWNCGVEGETDDVAINALRAQQQRNHLAALLLASGTPMLLMGDEVGHTKGGNNNTYCVDGPANYLDWDAARADEMALGSPALEACGGPGEVRRAAPPTAAVPDPGSPAPGSAPSPARVPGLRRFVRALLALRRACPQLRRGIYPGPEALQWHGHLPGAPDWSDSSRLLAFSSADDARPGHGLYAAFNASHEAQMVRLPEWYGREWVKLIDTSRPAPYDALFLSDALDEARLRAALAADAGARGANALLLPPYSCSVCVAVPEGDGGQPISWASLSSERDAEWMRGGDS